MSEGFRKFRRQLIIGLIIKFALILLLWLVVARTYLHKKAELEPASGAAMAAALTVMPARI
jgi:hypothetical protein